MTTIRTAPYGSWPSPITSELIVTDTVGLGQVEVEGGDVWWAEARPAEQGRVVVVRRRADGAIADAFGPGWNARTRVHEYGGSSFAVDGDTLYFTNFAGLGRFGLREVFRPLDRAFGLHGVACIQALAHFFAARLTEDGRFLGQQFKGKVNRFSHFSQLVDDMS